jgi:hypothetical protein
MSHAGVVEPATKEAAGQALGLDVVVDESCGQVVQAAAVFVDSAAEIRVLSDDVPMALGPEPRIEEADFGEQGPPHG